MEGLFPAVPNFAELTLEEITEFIASTSEQLQAVGAAPHEYVTESLDSDGILEQMEGALTAVQSARAIFAERQAEEATPDPAEVEETENEEFAARAAELAAQATAEPEHEPVQLEAVPEPEPETVAAAATPTPTEPPRLPRPARSRAAAPSREATPRVALTAAAAGLGPDLGSDLSTLEIAQMMIKRRSQFGQIPEGTKGERFPIARADWKDSYPDDRRLMGNDSLDRELIASAVNDRVIQAEFRKRQDQALTAAAVSVEASPALCAPVAPYYGISDISTATRPVRAALPAFGADRGGLRYSRPSTIADITTAIGVVTAAEDAQGGTFATKGCQAIDCPDWEEVDTAAIYHCLEIRNRIARTFPELIAHWTGLTLSAQARFAESLLLSRIDESGTEVVAGSLGLGASASLVNQYLTAANGMRNRHRMASDAVLRVLLPSWAVDLFISDVMRTQFERFDTDAAKVVALFRQFNIEPSFYIDGAAGRQQVFGTQTAGDLLPFPSEVVGYLYPEGSFLFLDGGTLEIGLVRDSVLNAQNLYQLFGETFEEVAFIGVESLTLVSSVCDSGTVTLPHATTCPIDYTPASA